MKHRGDTKNLEPIPEIVRINAARKRENMDPLPDDATLTETLLRAGFTECIGKPYKKPEAS